MSRNPLKQIERRAHLRVVGAGIPVLAAIVMGIVGAWLVSLGGDLKPQTRPLSAVLLSKITADVAPVGQARGVIAQGIKAPARISVASTVDRTYKGDKSMAGPWSDDEAEGDTVNADMDLEGENTSKHVMTARLQ